MKKISGIKLVCLGIIIYAPIFILQSLSDIQLPTWLFITLAIPSGLCLLIGLLQMHLKKEDELDDSLKESIHEKKQTGLKKSFLIFNFFK